MKEEDFEKAKWERILDAKGQSSIGFGGKGQW